MSDHSLPFSPLLPLFLLFLSEFPLHLLKCTDERRKILNIEEDGRLLAATGLLRHLDELSVSRLLQVDVERALARADRDGMELLSIASAVSLSPHGTRSTLRRSFGKIGRWSKWIITSGTGEIGHRVEHRKEVKEIIRLPSPPT